MEYYFGQPPLSFDAATLQYPSYQEGDSLLADFPNTIEEPITPVMLSPPRPFAPEHQHQQLMFDNQVCQFPKYCYGDTNISTLIGTCTCFASVLQGNEPVIQLPYVGGTQIIPWTCIVNADPTTRGIPVLPPSCITSQDAFKTTLERFNTLSEDRRRLVNIQPQDQDEGELLVLDTILDLFDEFDATRSNEGDFEASSNTMLSLLQPEYRKKAPKGPGSRDGVDYWVCKWPGCRHTTPRYPNAVSHVYAHAKIKPFPCNICHRRFRRKHDRKRHSKDHEANSKADSRHLSNIWYA